MIVLFLDDYLLTHIISLQLLLRYPARHQCMYSRSILDLIRFRSSDQSTQKYHFQVGMTTYDTCLSGQYDVTTFSKKIQSLCGTLPFTIPEGTSGLLSQQNQPQWLHCDCPCQIVIFVRNPNIGQWGFI